MLSLFAFRKAWFLLSSDKLDVAQDVVDPVMDEMLARFVVDSHFKSHPKTVNQEAGAEARADHVADPEVAHFLITRCSAKTSVQANVSSCLVLLQVLSQDMLRKYVTYAKQNVFPKLLDADLEKVAQVYADLRKESSVRLGVAFMPWNGFHVGRHGMGFPE